MTGESCIPVRDGGPSSGTPPKGCSSWEDFVLVLFSVVFVWIFFFAVAFPVASYRPGDMERAEKTLRNAVRIMATNKYWVYPMVAFSAFHCLAHVERMLVLMPGMHSMIDDMEIYACYATLVEMLTVLIWSIARSKDEVVSLFIGRLWIDCSLVMSVFVRRYVAREGAVITFSYLASFRLVMFWQYRLNLKKRNLTLNLLTAVFSLASFVFCLGCVLVQVETLMNTEISFTLDKWPTNMTSGCTGQPGDGHYRRTPTCTGKDPEIIYRWTLSAAIYFVMTTITAVAYGDLFPRTIPGQIVMVVTTCQGLYMLLKCGLGVVQAVDIAHRGGGRYVARRGAKHVVITGCPNFVVIKNFLEEMYHEDHAKDAEDLNTIVFLLPGQKSCMHALKTYLRMNTALQHKVWLIQGSCLKMEDLDRICYKESSVCFVMPDLFTTDPEREDLENVMRALSMRKHTGYIRIVPMLLRSEYRDLMRAAGIAPQDIICVDELKLGLLGKSCDIQGFITLVCTLIRNCGNAKLPTLPGESPEPWAEHYLHGFGNEMYEAQLSAAYRGAPFGEIALDIMHRSEGHCYLVGIVEEPMFPGDETITRLFPGRFFRCATARDRTFKGVFICQSKEMIVQHPPESQFKWSLRDQLQGEQETSRDPRGAVPEIDAEAGASYQLTTKAVTARTFQMPGKYGWIKDPFYVEKEHEEQVTGAMTTAAQGRTSQGLARHLTTEVREIERLLDTSGVRILSAEDEAIKAEEEAELAAAGIATDVVSMALKNHRARVSMGAAGEAQALAKLANDKEERRKNYQARKIMGWCEAELKLREEGGGGGRGVQGDREKTEDNILWGGPPDPPKTLHGSPEEPPPWILYRGGHIVFLHLEGDTTSKSRMGGKLCLEHFIRTLNLSGRHSKRPVVVLSNRVPVDWPQIAALGNVYLSIGKLSAQGLRRIGIKNASAVVIHQDGKVLGRDNTTMDAEAIFCSKVVDHLLTEENKDISVICDLTLEKNSAFVPLCKHERRAGMIAMKLELDAVMDLDEEDKKKTVLEELRNAIKLPIHMETRFIVGQLFSSNLLISMMANMLYNPALGALVKELVECRAIVVPVPDQFIRSKQNTFMELFEFVLRKRNLLVVALLRRQDEHVDVVPEMDEEEEEVLDSLQKAKKAREGPKVKEFDTWKPNDPAWQRFVFTMPAGDRLVADHDGLLCLQPSEKSQGLAP
eukprot:TRINITY_DN8722_c0_g1_i1.p1 TRINITY_DN8722_c0_g1~~TRINITY_DN8722_c0_g1_i1.p1  ORF type:complete len:1254 (+),score=313.94 TRINITY_DN8722_c0_g1_i1:150-3764(+)